MDPFESADGFETSEWTKVVRRKRNRKPKPAKIGEPNLKQEETENKEKIPKQESLAETMTNIESETENPKQVSLAEAATSIETEGEKPKQASLAEAETNIESQSEKPKQVSLAEAASKIDPSDLAAYLADSPTWFPGSELMELVDYFGKALDRVSSVQYPWPDMDKLFVLIDYPLNQFPRPVYKLAGEWIRKLPFKVASGFIVWAFDFFRARMGGYPRPKPDLAVFVVFSMVLRKIPYAYFVLLSYLSMEPFRSEAMLPVTVWAMAQVSQVDLCLGLYSWAKNLLPLAGDKEYYREPKSMDLVLQLVEAILSYPNARTILESDPPKEGNARLISPTQFEILLRLTFPPSYYRPKGTERFEAIYPLLKQLALADTPRMEATKRLVLEIFTFSFKLAGDGNRVLAKEATSIAIWCLTKNVDCCNHWDNVYDENPKASVVLLKKLVGKKKNHPHKLASSWRDTLTFDRTLKSFMLKNNKQITQGGANASLFRKADKYCKEISGRLRQGIGFLKVSIGSLYEEAGKYCEEISWRLSAKSGLVKGIAITAFVALVGALLQLMLYHYSITIRIVRL